MSKKNILLISYYWPPSGGAGVQRWLKMTKYLASEFNIHVYTPENPEVPATDDALLKEVHPNIKVVRTNILEPYKILGLLSGKKQNHSNYLPSTGKKTSFISKLMTWVRGNVFIPDPRMFWIRPSVSYLKKYIRSEKIDTIISTGPPHSMHVIALKLKKHFPSIKWLADFRDPWTFIDFFDQLGMNERSRKKHFSLEKAVFNKADHVVTVSPSWAKTYYSLYQRKVEVIYNGYDDADFIPPKNLEIDRYTIRYFGFMNADRNPDILWEALQTLHVNNPEYKNKLKVEIYGKANTLIQYKIKEYQLENTVHFKEYIPHHEVTQLMCQSGVLLLILNNTPNEDGILPGKMYEYMGAKRPILCIGNCNGDGAKILEECNAGKTFHFTDEAENVTQFLKEKIETENYEGKYEKIVNYTRKNQAEAYKKLLLS